MPNWIEGTLKLRGKNEDLKRFFTEGLEVSERVSDLYGKDAIYTEFNDSCCYVELKGEAWIKGTRRAFIEDSYASWNVDNPVVAVSIRQAWNFTIENWVDVSKTYNLDVRLYGIECGMEFVQELEVINGEVTVDKEITYENWTWECPMPKMGG